MSITINAFCLSHHLGELKKHSSKYLKMKIDEIPGSTITHTDYGIVDVEKNIYRYGLKEIGFNSIGTIYHVLMKIDPINISLKQWMSILNIINTTPNTIARNVGNRGNYVYTLNNRIDVQNIDKRSAIVYKFTVHTLNKAYDNNTPLCFAQYRTARGTIEHPAQSAPSKHSSICDIFKHDPINADYTFSEYIRYIVLSENAYEPSYIESLKHIHREMTDEPPIVGWDDDKLEYIRRTDDDSPFITKSELWELIQKLERGEDILPRERDTKPEPVKQHMVTHEPGRIRSRKSASPSIIKEAIKETTGYINPYEGLDDSSSSDVSSEPLTETPTDTSEPKTKIDPKMLDCMVLDYEPVKPLRLTTTAENVNIFLIVYAFIMTALVTIGMARR